MNIYYWKKDHLFRVSSLSFLFGGAYALLPLALVLYCCCCVVRAQRRTHSWAVRIYRKHRKGRDWSNTSWCRKRSYGQVLFDSNEDVRRLQSLNMSPNPGDSAPTAETTAPSEGATASSASNQQDLHSASSSYSTLAAKTVANIRRLQENVAAAAPAAGGTGGSNGGRKAADGAAAAPAAVSWAGNHQVLSPAVVPAAASSPVEAASGTEKPAVHQVELDLS